MRYCVDQISFCGLYLLQIKICYTYIVFIIKHYTSKLVIKTFDNNRYFKLKLTIYIKKILTTLVIQLRKY